MPTEDTTTTLREELESQLLHIMQHPEFLQTPMSETIKIFDQVIRVCGIPSRVENYRFNYDAPPSQPEPVGDDASQEVGVVPDGGRLAGQPSPEGLTQNQT